MTLAESAAAAGSVTIATNNGDIGGGEVMLLRIAEALRSLDVPVTVVGPHIPDGVTRAARDAGFATVVLPAEDRRGWMRALRRWDRRHRRGILWCNGLVPAFATAGHPGRIVHLHQVPTGAQRTAAVIARRGSLDVIVPSHSMARTVGGAHVLANWTTEFPAPRPARPTGPFVVGFLGRLSVDKGVPILADAMRMLDHHEAGRYRLVLGGEPLFVDDTQRAQVNEALGSIDGIVDRRGWMPPQDLFDEIDLLVVPSVWEEPFGLVAAEAMAARVPLIVSAAGALPEVVGADYPLIAPVGDARRLALTIADVAHGRIIADVGASFARWGELYSPHAGRGRVAEVLSRVSSLAR